MRALGVALIALAGIVVIAGFIRFATEGVGIPVPTEPTSRQLTIGGPYRYVRNPLYLAIVLAITGQALVLSRLVLLVYAAVMLASLSRSFAGLRSRPWPGVSAPSTSRTAGKCPAGGRACHTGAANASSNADTQH